MLGLGWNVACNYQEALFWFQKAAAQDPVDATFNLTVMYAKGEGLAQDQVAATKCLVKAARLWEMRKQKDVLQD